MERRFVKDYKYEGGRLVYTGALRRAVITRRRRVQALTAAAAAAALYVSAVFAGNMMTRWWPVGVPFAFLIAAVSLFCYEAARFYKLPADMERRHYEGAFLYAGVYAAVTAFFAAAAAVTGAVWLFKTDGADRREYLTPFICAGLAVVCFWFFTSWRSMYKSCIKIE